jgi:hypothetical protein
LEGGDVKGGREKGEKVEKREKCERRRKGKIGRKS